MENQIKIQKAKYYLDMLSSGIDPVSGNPIVDDSVINNNCIKNCFTYVSILLDKILKNGGQIVNITEKLPFSLNQQQIYEVKISQQPISMSDFVKNINSVIDKTIVKSFSSRFINAWLIEKGIFNLVEKEEVKIKQEKELSDRAAEIGIFEIEKTVKSTGEVKKEFVLSKEAQEYILQNITQIINK